MTGRINFNHPGNAQALVGVWCRLGQPRFGLADRISDAIAAREWQEPDLLCDPRNSRDLLLACDFAGAHRRARYEAFGFLVAGIEQSAEWLERRIEVRRNFLPDGRRMAYKALSDGIKRRALEPFLAAATTLHGNLIIVLVSKKIPRLFCDPDETGLFPEFVVAKRGWSQKAFRRLLLVSSIGALLIGGLSAPEQNILWLTDQDEIAANEQKHNHAGHVIHHCITQYSPKSKGVLTFVTTECPFDNNRNEDAVAIPDLAAGALVDVFSDFDARIGRGNQQIWLPIGKDIPGKARMILEWLSSRATKLRPLIVVLDQIDNHVGAKVFRPSRYETSALISSMPGDVFCLR